MESRITHVCYLLDFLDVDFSSENISSILKVEVDKIIRGINACNLSKWEIRFRATYTNAKQILISKNRLGSFPTDKYKEITIQIPIPTNNIVSWGVNKNQHLYDENHLDPLMRNFYGLDVDFLKYFNRRDYILDSMRKAIRFSFENGFTVDGVKVKVADFDSIT